MPDVTTAHTKYRYIDDVQTLKTLCKNVVSLDYITLDTEFVRSRTLFPALGLVQIFDGKQVYLIDTVKIDHLSPLKAVLTSPSLVKIIHSCSEDLDALSYNIGEFPFPVFDTQIAANFLGMGNSIGYANLVEKICDVKLDKTESRTDWIVRPLSANQLKYAAADVTFLYQIYEHLNPLIKARGWLDMLIAEANLIAHKKANPLPAEYAYLNYSNGWKLRQENLYALKLLAEWRLNEAKKENTAVNFILREQCVLEIALSLPKTKAHLSQIHGITSKQLRLYASLILGIINRVEDETAENYPLRIQRLNDFPLYKKVGNAIKRVVYDYARQQEIPETLLASKKQINEVLKWIWFNENESDIRNIKPDLLQGWRRDMLLEDLQIAIDDELRDTDVLRRL